MLEAVFTDLVSTISLKRSTQNLQLSTSWQADYPIFWQILLQKSQVAGRRIFRENMKQEAIADSYSLTRITEIACEFDVRR